MRNKYSEKITDELKTVVEELRHFEPDLLVVLGDIIQHENNAQNDRQNLRKVKEILERLECEKIYMGGNHDSMNLSNNELEEILGDELWGYRRLKGENLIFLNTSSPWLSRARGEVTNEQLDFLDEKLEELDKATLFVHHPVHYHDVSDTYWWSEIPEWAFCANKREVNEIFSKHGNVDLTVNGHLHENNFVEYKGIPHVTLTAFGKERREKPVTGTYALMEIGEHIDITEKIQGETVRSYNIER